MAMFRPLNGLNISKHLGGGQPQTWSTAAKTCQVETDPAAKQAAETSIAVTASRPFYPSAVSSLAQLTVIIYIKPSHILLWVFLPIKASGHLFTGAVKQSPLYTIV